MNSEQRGKITEEDLVRELRRIGETITEIDEMIGRLPTKSDYLKAAIIFLLVVNMIR